MNSGAPRTMTRYCEVCGAELKPNQEKYCSPQCKAIAQTKEWQLIQELRKSGRVTLVQLRIIVSQRYGVKSDAHIEERISRIMGLLRELSKIDIIIRA
ncbi:hypothetical protein [Archaeoglobus sp. UBA231]|uniref:hypothetical protein n=1 Tax=Archaeoglobus sp. UBA231 TaxID=1915566 RepID=UPI0025C14E13|nr:hypothetical protein [Archaeoglobus sp. UBA231]